MNKKAQGGWPQPKERSPAFRIVVGTLIAVVIVGGMVALMMYTIDNADEIPAESDWSGQPDIGSVD